MEVRHSLQQRSGWHIKNGFVPLIILQNHYTVLMVRFTVTYHIIIHVHRGTRSDTVTVMR